MIAVRDNVKVIYLDTRGLDVSSVKVDNKEVKFEWTTMEEPMDELGVRLDIHLAPESGEYDYTLKRDQEVKVLIKYDTTPQSTALNWLKKE